MTETPSAHTGASNRTLLENGIITSLTAKLVEHGVPESVIAAVTEAYGADRVPSAEKLFTSIKQAVDSSGDGSSE